MLTSLRSYLQSSVPIAPLLVFRWVFGAVMMVSTLRFMLMGWIEDHYVYPVFYFKYWGLGWVQPVSAEGLYAVHILLIVACVGVMFAQNIWYRISAITLWLTFTYIELIDLTYYLNHYYFVSCVCLLLCLLPNEATKNWRYFYTAYTPRWCIVMLKTQIAIVYIYAGIAKIHSDWLLEALPLKIWLPPHDKMPIIGEVFTWKITPYLFAWGGMLYDTFIVFFLMYRKTRLLAYCAVVAFHSITGSLFQIGIFPLLMTGCTLIFFDWNKKLPTLPVPVASRHTNYALSLLGFYFLFQFLFPFRYLLYPSNSFWSEEGYRFSWKVMLMEKAGTATFYVKDTKTGKEGVVDNAEFLKPHQEKQMSMQPDLILQFAHFLGNHYEKAGIHNPEVRAEVYVTLNGRPSRLLIDPKRDLMKERDTFAPKNWILPY